MPVAVSPFVPSVMFVDTFRSDRPILGFVNVILMMIDNDAIIHNIDLRTYYSELQRARDDLLNCTVDLYLTCELILFNAKTKLKSRNVKDYWVYFL